MATDGGKIVAAGGGNLVSNSSGTLVGTPTNSAGFHAAADGNLTRAGSAAGLVSHQSPRIQRAGDENAFWRGSL